MTPPYSPVLRLSPIPDLRGIRTVEPRYVNFREDGEDRGSGVRMCTSEGCERIAADSRQKCKACIKQAQRKRQRGRQG